MRHACQFKVLSCLLSPIRKSVVPSSRGHLSQIAIASVATLTFCAGAIAAAQQTATTLDPNAITGFENLGTWDVRGSAAQPGFMVTSTTNRTQGSAAYSISNPPNMVKLMSQPIASTATALAGIGNAGALLQIDVLIPIQQGNAVNSGWIQLFVTSPSRGLNKVLLGKVDFNNYRPGIYNTISFAIPDEVSSALGSTAFSDLRFEFDVSSPGRTTGTYLFDNLRVHFVPLEQSPTGTPPPPGYGGSVDLVVFGNAPVTQNFNLGPTQIPYSFHLKRGGAGMTTIELQLGLDGNPEFTCTYDQATTGGPYDSYTLQACSNGFEAGDLVPANWVNLAIVGGDSTQEIRAQIAMNPMGDLTGAGLLPPMPTFWGDADTCVPAPVPGTVVTTSGSCANQVAEANQIVTNYFQQVIDANPTPNWIVTPVPEYALRRGDGTPTNNLNGPPPTPTDPPFDTGSHLNSGGSFDAYWGLSGNLTPTAFANTDETKTHFDATFFAHGVLFAKDVDVMDITVNADTDSGQTTPSCVAASSTGTVHLYVFGNEVPSGAITFDPNTGFGADPTWTQNLDLPPLEFWIFNLTLGATASADVRVSSSRAPKGSLVLTVTPSASLGGHISGGVNLGVASGTVNAQLNFASLSTPASATSQWLLNKNPSVCTATVNGLLHGDLTLSSAGGRVDLNACFGVCPVCYTKSVTLFKWDGLASKTWNLMNDPIGPQSFPLPPSSCCSLSGSWQGTYTGQTFSCAQRDANGCCVQRGGKKVIDGPESVTFTQNGTSVSTVVEGEELTGTNIDGAVSLSTTVAADCGTSDVPAGLSATLSSDCSTLSGSFYVKRSRTITGTFSLHRPVNKCQ
jgi:hypothetical protein